MKQKPANPMDRPEFRTAVTWLGEFARSGHPDAPQAQKVIECVLALMQYQSEATVWHVEQAVAAIPR